MIKLNISQNMVGENFCFLGTDSFRPLTSFSPEMIPLNDLNTNIVFGINFPFGKYNGRFPKQNKEVKSKKNADMEE